MHVLVRPPARTSARTSAGGTGALDASLMNIEGAVSGSGGGGGSAFTAAARPPPRGFRFRRLGPPFLDCAFWRLVLTMVLLNGD